jgi:RND family efflux transporter MFP subunit
MKSGKSRFLALGLLLCGVPLGCSRAPAPAEEKVPPAPVKWLEARQLMVEEWTEIIGTTQPLPDRAARVTAAVEGHVVSILGGAAGKPLVEGQRVAKGDVLVRLDDSVARANRDKLVVDQEVLQHEIKQAGFGVELAANDLHRLEELSKKTSTGTLTTFATAVELERARVILDEAKSKQHGAELHPRAGEMQLKALDEQLKYYSLTAPISGRLGRIFVVPGQTLSIGALVAEILDIDDQIDLLCFVPPYLAQKLKEGQLVQIGGIGGPSPGQPPVAEGKDSSAAKGKTVGDSDGKIVYIADQAEVDTGNFAVKVRFPNAGLGLRSNVTLRARVLTAPGKACLALRESALMEDQDPPAVIVVEDHKEEKTKEGKDIETGKARKLRVKVGIRDRVKGLVEILSLDDPEKKWQGSLETAKFVVERGQGLRNGDAIKLEEDEDEAPPEEKKEDKP